MEKLQVLADKDCAGALTAAGIILKSSREKTDRVKALEMLEKAAGLGDEMALRIFGEICRDGMPGIFERDPEKARECFEKLDEAGNELGSVLLAKLYRMDNDVIERDYMKAFSLLEKAAEKKALFSPCIDQNNIQKGKQSQQKKTTLSEGKGCSLSKHKSCPCNKDRSFHIKFYFSDRPASLRCGPGPYSFLIEHSIGSGNIFHSL